MLPDMTPAVARAYQAAQSWAARAGASEVFPVHLLLGLLDEPEGKAATLLARVALDPARVQSALRPGQEVQATAPLRAVLPVSLLTEQAFDQARRVARSQGIERAVTSEALLLAILRVDEALRRDLEALGLVWSALEGQAAPPPETPLGLDEPLDLRAPGDEITTARILDANANRAREGLRVAEDYCRFVLDDALLCGELKRLRHDLTQALADFDPGQELTLAARDTPGDVGTGLSTAGERERGSPLAVVRANLKRVQEALRGLEEFGKLHSAALGRAFERMRYDSYTLEKAIAAGARAGERLARARLYVLVTGSACAAALDWTIREAVAGGADVIQLREKSLPDAELLRRAREVRRWTREAGVLFLMNDRPDLARLAEADGVHLGQDDLPVHDARRIVGPDALVGASTHNLDQLRRAVLDGADYVGVGPTFPSETKDFAEFPGLDYVRRAAAATSLPQFVLGGVNRDTIAAAVAAGARRVAVGQAVCGADDPRAAARELRSHLGDS